MGSNGTHTKMRIYHRYLGYFLAGIMAVYGLSGTIMIFRDTDFLKMSQPITRQLKPNIKPDELGRELRIKDFKIDAEEGDLIKFDQGTYNKSTGIANYTSKEWPRLIDRLTQLHKADTRSPLFFLNVFFGVSLLFFVLSAFWMFLPKTTIFKKGLYFTFAGIIVTLILLVV
jgi:hypothetical protein